MTAKEKNIIIYRTAYEYLLSILPEGVSDLESYFVGDSREFDSLEKVFEVLLQSAQEYQRLPNVIQFVKRKDKIRGILYGFDFRKVASCNPEDLYYKFRETFNVTSKDSKNNLWYRWSCAVVDSSIFLSQFESIEDFKGFVDLFSYNSTTRMALPLVISTKIRGVGFALACNFLKELGYLNYPKPDVHMIDICVGLGISDKEPASVFEAIVKIAEDNGVTPYRVDKVFWLICSGRFYKEDITIGRHKDEFIALAKEKVGV